MSQTNLVIGKCYETLKDLYKDQNDEKKAEIRAFYRKLGFSERSIFRKIEQKHRDTQELDSLFEGLGICRTTKQGYFFELSVPKNETFGLS